MDKKVFICFIALVAFLFGCHFMGVIDLTDSSCNVSKMGDTETFQKECIEESPNGKIFWFWSK